MERRASDPLAGSMPADANLADGILAHGATTPERPALVLDGRTVSYDALRTRIAAMAASLRRSGLAPGARIALAAADAEGSTVALLGATLAGFVAVPVAPDLPADERARLVADLAIAETLTDAAIPAMVEAGMGADAVRERAPGGDAPATVLLSSGTTGRPKAMVLSHRRQLWNLRAANFALDAVPTDRYFAMISPSFAFGRNPMLRVLEVGGTVVRLPLPTDVREFAAMIAEARITDISATPSHIRDLLADWREERPVLPGLKRLLVSTAFLHQSERLEALRRISPRLHVCLGMNEVGFVAIARPEDLPRLPDTVGRAIPGVTVEVVDDEGRSLPPGAIGELRVAAPSLPDGYLDAPEASRINFRSGWFHPGDLASLDAEGFLHLLGRVDDRINRSGVKIYPIEIERVLRAHPAVADAAVVGMEALRAGEEPVAAVVLSAPVAPAALVRWCRERIDPAKAPTRIVPLPALPRNAAGKVPAADLRRILLEAVRAARRTGR